MDYWQDKIAKNRQRDMLNHERLQDAGWKVLVIWECEAARHEHLEALAEALREGMSASQS
jgi:DNA mismatch endonuclease (patch repair protein)